jgi:hypothetical protein
VSFVVIFFGVSFGGKFCWKFEENLKKNWGKFVIEKPLET